MKTMKTFHIGFYYLFISAMLVLAVSFLALKSISPDERILGLWEEVAWEYEKVDKIESENKPFTKQISEGIKQEIIESLIIHQAETWNFLPDGTLNLSGKDNNEAVPLEWNLKGRGHVLKLKHADKKTEHYTLQRINNDEMVLYFNSDINAKGIVKMTFRKING
ncbi:hypothetical protein U1E44_06255 [Arenibacter sp. GZD96]|uniref:hypothetical protein n=1 Tax=Aurantibrevibacter litoralis TaxID=3106030 RepID=UPI002AFDEEF5|nr:hypothetical protein [Arenibacter sp. GZD-96]MEA1785684.1 hypothetical protein [Arenibacter sp. GZD-96]